MTTMSCRERIAAYLDEQEVPFTRERHRVVFTTSEVAQAEHVPGRQVAKAVMVWLGGELTMVVLPAPARVPLHRLAALFGADDARLADEREFAGLFADCEPGAVPPFGNLYGLPVYLHPALADQEEIVVQPGCHDETFRLRYADYARLVQPVALPIAQQG